MIGDDRIASSLVVELGLLICVTSDYYDGCAAAGDGGGTVGCRDCAVITLVVTAACHQ